MSDRFIRDARHILGVASPKALADRQAKVLNRQRAKGIPVKVQTVDDPTPARIEHNRWILDCRCGSGVAVHPGWKTARCLAIGCGRVYTKIVIPEDQADIEKVLAARPFEPKRNWRPGETVADLEAENAAMKVPT